MSPWIPNLCFFCTPSGTQDAREKRAKTEEIMKQFIEITVEEPEMYPSLQSKVWYSIGGVEELVDLALNNLIQHALQNQLGSRAAEVVADTAVTLASANVELVAGKIISRLRR